jgi:hypothetical protein
MIIASYTEMRQLTFMLLSKTFTLLRARYVQFFEPVQQSECQLVRVLA